MLWAWSAMLALLCTLISYPGIWYSDSYVRVTTGEAVLNAVVKMLQGHRALLETHNAFSLIPSFFIAASLGATGHVAFYTFAQAFAFFAAVFLLIRELCPPGWKPFSTAMPTPITWAFVCSQSFIIPRTASPSARKSSMISTRLPSGRYRRSIRMVFCVLCVNE